MSSTPEDAAIRAAFERVRHTDPAIAITVMIRTDHGETGWVPVPGERYGAIVNAACTPAAPPAPWTPVGKRVKSMPDRRVMGTIDSENRDAPHATVTITWDNGDTTVERYGDLGLTWAYAPDRTTSTTDKEG